MKICYVNCISPATVYGGAERVVLEEARMMADRGNEVIIISLKPDRNAPSVAYLHQRQIRNLFIPSIFRLPTSIWGKGYDILSSLWNPIAMVHLKRVLAAERPDIVHVHQLGQISVCALREIRKLGFRIIQTFHGYYYECPTGSLTKMSGGLCNRRRLTCKIYEKFYSRDIRSCALIIAISPHVKRRLEQLGYDSRRVRLIPNSIAAKQTGPIPATDKPKEILYVGRMTTAKGAHILIKALSKVKEEFAASFIGIGERLPYFRSLAKRLHVKARFLGRVSDETLADYYRRVDIVVVPSLFPELCSMVILEAMSFGKPVIASDIGGNPFLVSDRQTGYLFEPNNEAELAECISDLLLNERLASEMGKRSQRATRRFSEQAHGRLLMQAYREVSGYGKSD